MAIPDADFKTFLTGAVGSDGGGAQNDPDSSLGPWRSTTEASLTLANLFEGYTSGQLTASTRYRWVALTNVNVTGVRNACRIISNDLTNLKTGLTVSFGIQTNDTSTSVPTCTDTTAPAGITFFTPVESTGIDITDYTTARPIGPLNADSDGSTDLNFDDSMVIFVCIRIVASGASGTFTDGVDNEITPRSIGFDTI